MSYVLIYHCGQLEFSILLVYFRRINRIYFRGCQELSKLRHELTNCSLIVREQHQLWHLWLVLCMGQGFCSSEKQLLVRGTGVCSKQLPVFRSKSEVI